MSVLSYSSKQDMTGALVLSPRMKMGQSWLRTAVQLLIIFVLSAVICGAVLAQHYPDEAAALGRALFGSRAIVSGIMYDGERPLAIVCGKVVGQGDVVDGFLVARINPGSVELVRDNDVTTEVVAAAPARAHGQANLN